MVTLFIYLIYLLILGICILLFVLFVTLAIVKRKKKTTLKIYVVLSTVFMLAVALLWTTDLDLNSAETTDKEEAIGAFESNFGFKPPNSVEEIKLKNYAIYDACAHWMTFTYDSIVFNKILAHDQPLDIALIGTQKYDEIKLSLKQGCANCPDWLELPNSNTLKIFYKKDFLDHSSSEYYLWVDTQEKMVYLEVSYFD